MKGSFFNTWAPAFGMTTLCCLWILGPLVSSDHDAIYHWSGPANTLFIPALLEFCGVWLLLTLLLVAAQGKGRRPITIWLVIIFLLPWITLKSCTLLNNWMLPRWVSRGLLGVSLAALIVVVLRWKPSQRVFFRPLKRLATTILCFVAVSGLLSVGQLLWFGWRARFVNAPRPFHAMSRPAVSSGTRHSRIIWIVLDELSYQQVYEQRFAGLQLPAFDQLASEATVFTHTVPSGIMTELVLPSLMTGLPIDKIRPSADGGLLAVRDSQTGKWQNFDQHATVFQDALNAGYKTAVAGWYNPYCRILPEVLDRCFWTFSLPSANDMLPTNSIGENVVHPLLHGFAFADHVSSEFFFSAKANEISAGLHIADYRDLFGQADRILQDSSYNFVLLHMPVPHPGGIYNRTTQTFATSNSSYLDNLALADSYLAHVRSLLQSQGQWDSSAIVVMGDHSWRTKLLWTADPDWTDEERKGSNNGRFDDRPGYIVKMPNQRSGFRIDRAFPAVNTRALFNAIMSGQVNSPEALSSWVEKLSWGGTLKESAALPKL